MSKNAIAGLSLSALLALAIALSLATILAGCAAVEDPCAIVLRDDPAGGSGDPAMARVREQARHAAAAQPYLERLGWMQIAREAIDHDHVHFERALQAAACMERGAPGSPEARLLRAHALVSMHRFKEGEMVARGLVAESPSWMASGVLGDALVEQGRLEEAAVQYQAMADANPGSQAWSRAAHLRWLLGDRVGAIEAMSRAAEAGDGRDPRAGAWYRGRLAYYALEAGRLDDARRFSDAALALAPRHPQALHARGLVLLDEGRPVEAVEALRAAVVADPLPEYLWALSEALTESGQRLEARKVEARLRIEGEREDPRGVALFLASRGADTGRAVSLARAELKVRQDPVTLDVLATALAADGRVAEAREYSRRARASGTRAPRLALHGAVIAAAAGEAAEAAALAEEAGTMSAALLPSERRLLASLRHPEGA
jgi:tetratricopeptide (TPR) repeat protein